MWHVTPVGLDLAGRKCIVIGGGAVATRRVAALLGGGAQVTVISRSVSSEIERLVQAGKITTHSRAYSADALQGAFLVVVATDDTLVNSQVAHDARAAGCLVSDADEPERGDCVFPSVVRRGGLVISITTGGARPSLAMRIRDALENDFGPEYEEYVALLGEARKSALAQIADNAGRKTALSNLAADTSILELIRNGQPDEARLRAFACISPSSD